MYSGIIIFSDVYENNVLMYLYLKTRTRLPDDSCKLAHLRNWLQVTIFIQSLWGLTCAHGFGCNYSDGPWSNPKNLYTHSIATHQSKHVCPHIYAYVHTLVRITGGPGGAAHDGACIPQPRVPRPRDWHWLQGGLFLSSTTLSVYFSLYIPLCALLSVVSMYFYMCKYVVVWCVARWKLVVSCLYVYVLRGAHFVTVDKSPLRGHVSSSTSARFHVVCVLFCPTRSVCVRVWVLAAYSCI